MTREPSNSQTDTPAGYASVFETYHQLGWSVLPLPRAKKQWPPKGYTGAGGAIPSYADMLEWSQQSKYQDGNVAIRLPHNVIGIDVDDYDSKHGGDTIAEGETRWGALPVTYRSTSRVGSKSGIRLYRIPDGVKLCESIKFEELGLGHVEIIQFHQRYALCWPSIHDKTGATYYWVAEIDGTVMDSPPAPVDIPELPTTWLDALRDDHTSADAPAESDTDVRKCLTTGEPSQAVAFKLAEAMSELFAPECRHDAVRDRVLGLLRLGKRGEPGVDRALRALSVAFINRVYKDRGGGKAEARQEFSQFVNGPMVARLLADTSYDTDEPIGAAQLGETDGDTDDYRELRIATRVERLQEEAEARRRIKSIESQQLRETLTPPITLTEFLSVPDTEAQYRISELLPIGGRAIVAAQYKAGKTTLVDNLVRALADNTLFLNAFRVCPTHVALLDTEMDERQMRRWLRQQQIQNPAEVLVKPLRGRVSAFNILDPELLAMWSEWLRGYDVVVLDCLRPVLDALSLSEDHDAGRFLVAFDELLNRCGASEAVIVDHMGHNGDRTRGDSRKLDWPDVTWRIVRDKDVETPDDPSAERYFSAYGRDVDVTKGRLEYNSATRQLTYTGLPPAFAKAESLVPNVIQLLTKRPGLTAKEIDTALAPFGTRQRIRDAVATTVANGDVLIDEEGKSHAKKHFLNPSRKPFDQ